MTGNRPSFLLTFDTELFWGLHDLPRFADREAEMGAVRPALDRILEILDDRRVPATFAVVGRLFLPDGEVGDGPLHPDLAADWPRRASAGDLAHPEAWFGRDVVDRIAASDGGHEIGGHGFTHVDLDRLDAAGAERDVGATVAAADAAGVRIRSWVHPRNRIAHEEVLARHGIVAMRAAPPPRPRALRFFDQILARGVVAEAPWVAPSGLVVMPAGSPVLPGDGIRRALSRGRRRALVRRGLEDAARTGGTLHVWAHPHNFVRRDDAMLRVLTDLADEVAAARDRMGLAVATMGALADRVLADAEGGRP